MSTSQERIYGKLVQSIGKFSPSQPLVPKADFPDEDFPNWPSDLSEENSSVQRLENIWRTNDISNDTDRDILGPASNEQGMDVLAFYKSFRHRDDAPYPGRWGIFYLEAGLSFISNLIGCYVESDSIACDRLAVDFIRRHEVYHYFVDMLSLSIEPPLQKHLYSPYRHAYKRCPSRCVEEALANNRAWMWAKSKEKFNHGLLEFAEEFMSGQPNAYARYGEGFDILSGGLSENLVMQRYGSGCCQSLSDWAAEMPSHLPKSIPPEYVVLIADLATLFPGLIVFPRIAKITDSKHVMKILKKKGLDWQQTWDRQKKKLLVFPGQNGLGFKPWAPIPGVWSVNLNEGDRAHLMPDGNDRWTTIDIGSHTAMGHG